MSEDEKDMNGWKKRKVKEIMGSYFTPVSLND